VRGGGDSGGAAPPFTWTQTAEEVELTFAVPAVTKAKDVTVIFGLQSCSVALAAGAKPVMSGTLASKVNVDECTWSLMGDGERRKLQVTLFKQSTVSWPGLMAAAAS
jgi:hypothetical protein